MCRKVSQPGPSKRNEVMQQDQTGTESRLVWPGVENQLEELDVFSESLVEIKRVLPTQGRKSGVSETVFDSLATASDLIHL